MAVRNLMEDIVDSLVEEVLAKTNRDEKDDAVIYKDDVVTYVLNRIPPKYYTSERGMLHGKLDSQFVFQQKTDILLLAHEGIKIIKKRRSSELPAFKEDKIKEYFLPHILGEVLEETTFSIIPKVTVTLLYNDKPAGMIDKSWKNPYVTNKSTKGFFHFWPNLQDFEKEIKKGGREIPFSVLCSHPKFNKKKMDLSLSIAEGQNSHKSYIMPMILMEKLEGVDLSFLSE